MPIRAQTHAHARQKISNTQHAMLMDYAHIHIHTHLVTRGLYISTVHFDI